MITEVNIFGVFVSPYAIILLACWLLVFLLRMTLTRLGVLMHAWHPALLMFSIFTALFSVAVLVAASVS